MPSPSSRPPREPGDAHYFSDAPEVPSAPERVRLQLPDLTLDLTTDRGVFSADRVDPGTRLLLGELADLSGLPDGALADVGCGYGPIAVTLGLRYPERQVWAVDVNARARELCGANAAAAGATVRVVGPPDVPDDLAVAAVVSNPPIRIGKAALHRLLEEWLDRLVPGGEAWLVVHRHLGADSLTRWLQDRGDEVTRVRSRQGYRILRVRPTATTPLPPVS